MTKKDKGLLIAVAIITVLLIIVYVFVHNASLSQTVFIQYPEGTLSDSLFVSQNNTYTENQALPVEYDFERIPFSIDLPSGSSANVGNGTIVKVNEQFMIYISEHDANTNAQTLFLSEFPTAIMMNYSPLYTYAQTQTSQSGYINGSSADYEFDLINISDGAKNIPAYAAMYDITQLEKEEYESKIIVAAITTNTDNDSLASTKALIDAIMLTFRYNENLDRAMKNGSSSYITPDVADIEDVEEEKKPTSVNEVIRDSDIDATLKGVNISEEYEDLYITIYYETPAALPVLTLYDTQFNTINDKVVADDYTSTTFHVGKVTADKTGKYILKITHSGDTGNITMKLEDLSVNEGAGDIEGETEINEN